MTKGKSEALKGEKKRVRALFRSASATSDCPPNAAQQAKACTAMLGLEPAAESPSEFIKEGDSRKALHACSNGDLLDIINCQERILDLCKHDKTDSAHFLRNMIDIEKSREAVTFFCTNVRVYARNADCVAKHHIEQVECAQEAINNFQTQALATTNMDSLMRFQCRLYDKVVRCTDEVLTKKCSTDVAYIVTTIMRGFEPPTCNNTQSAGIKARKTGASYDFETQGSKDNKENSAYTTYCAQIFTFFLCLFFTLLG
ncbi:hypothetical protein PoB_005568700 [Plakobranchus ocellatus]|uniref:Uncharacterized protein n=1 Tax=Plakobranchus ocellatus TaxID=259542 RepID=A0AAV4CCW9_9GAST|nr:hypothetical protein PoB_005568700 [Plakobranchus ocellatus]